MQASDIEDTIISQMNDMLLVSSYASYAEENGIKHPREGWSIENIPMPTSDGAKKAYALAVDIYNRIEEQWLTLLHHPEHLSEPSLAEIVYNHCEWELGSDEPEVVLPLVESWASDATMTACGDGVRWEDDHHEVMYQGIELTINGSFCEYPMWDDSPSDRRRLNLAQACEIASHLHISMYDPIYAFSSTGKVQSEEHRTNTMTSLRKCLNMLAEQYPLVPDDIQDLADLIAYVAAVPVREV